MRLRQEGEREREKIEAISVKSQSANEKKWKKKKLIHHDRIVVIKKLRIN